MKKLFTSIFLIASILISCTSNKHIRVCGDEEYYNYVISGISPICLGGYEIDGPADTIGTRSYWVMFTKSKVKAEVVMSCNSDIWDFYNSKDVVIIDTILNCSH
jgi:hypothetical protein